MNLGILLRKHHAGLIKLGTRESLRGVLRRGNRVTVRALAPGHDCYAGEIAICRRRTRNDKVGTPVAQGLSKVTNSALPPQTVIPAKAGIQKAVVLRMSWIPAFAGMTD